MKEIDKMKKATYVIGDVHGCYNTLIKLVKKLPKNADLIFVGDLVDKGPNSKKVIDFVIENNYRCIKGNHEKYMSLYIEEAIYKNIQNKWSTSYNKYGGAQTLDNYIDDTKKLYELLVKEGSNKLVGDALTLDEKIFYKFDSKIDWKVN